MSDINPYSPPKSDISVASSPSIERPLAQRRARLFAQLIDGFINVVILLPLEYVAGSYKRISDAVAAGHHLNMEAIVWGLLGAGLYLALNWGLLAQGQTIGKRIMGIRIVRKDGTAADRKTIVTKRLLPFWLAANIPYIGPFILLVDTLCIFRAGQNTLHDDFANTVVVKV